MEKTIIYTGPFAMPDVNAAAHRVLNNAKILHRLGYKVVFLGVNDNASADVAKTRYSYSGFDIWEIKCKTSIEKMKKMTLCNELKFVLSQYENVSAIIAYDYYATGLLYLKKICRRKGIKLFADTDEWFGFTGSSFADKVIRWVDSQMRMRLIQPTLDGLIVISKYLQDYYKKKTPTFRVPPLTDLSEEKWNKVPEERSETINLMYAGTTGKNKDKINLIIEALLGCENVRFKFTVVGLSKEQYLSYYPEHKSVLEALGEKVVFEGRIPHSSVIERVKKSDFTMFYRDVNRVTMAGFPTKFAESITCGTPVITTRTSDIGDYLVDGGNGFFIDEEDITGSIRKVLSQDIAVLKSIKANVDCGTFDYNNYIEAFRGITEII